MSDFYRSGGVAGRLLIVIVAVILTFGSGRVAMAAEPQLRGIWMHANFIRTPAEADRCIDIDDPPSGSECRRRAQTAG